MTMNRDQGRPDREADNGGDSRHARERGAGATDDTAEGRGRLGLSQGERVCGHECAAEKAEKERKYREKNREDSHVQALPDRHY